MRKVNKSAGGGYYLDCANENPPESAQQASSRWSGYSHKAPLANQLCSEQYGLCAYSEVAVGNTGFGTHIEHIKPKSLHPELTFDYHNLVLSVFSSDALKKLDAKDVFGGHAKGGEYDASKFISPLEPSCPEFFIYKDDGEVEPNMNLSPCDTVKAHYTINLLNLNAEYLIVERQKLVDEIDGYIDDHIDKGMSLYHLAACYLLPLRNKNWPFFSLVRQRFGFEAESVLAAEAPNLV